MVRAIASFERALARFGLAQSLGLGVVVALVAVTPGLLLASELALVVAILAYIPLHAWWTLSTILVVLSRDDRNSLVGSGFGPIKGGFARVYSPYGMFCIGCFGVLCAAAAKLES